MHELTIKKNDAGQRLDKFITKTLHLPTSLLHKSIRLKKIKVNRKRAEGSQMLVEGDTVQCFLAEEFFEAAGLGNANASAAAGTEERGATLKAKSLAAIHPSLSVIYEDENILLLDKRPGVSVHEDEHESTNTLITQIQAYLYQKGDYDPDAGAAVDGGMAQSLEAGVHPADRREVPDVGPQRRRRIHKGDAAEGADRVLGQTAVLLQLPAGGKPDVADGARTDSVGLSGERQITTK